METFNNTELTTAPSVRDLQESPQYAGTYWNMARHNIFQILSTLNQKLERILDKTSTKLDDDANIDKFPVLELFNPSNKWHKVYGPYVFKVMKKYLPFIRIFDQEDIPKTILADDGIDESQPIIDFDRLYRFLKGIFAEVVQFRNSTTHFLSVDDFGTELPRKDRLEPSLVTPVKLLFDYAPYYLVQRFAATQEEKEDGFQTEHFSSLSMHTLFSDESNGVLSNNGIRFLICLFLEQKEGLIFLKRFRGYKNDTTKIFRATLRAYTAYAVKLPSEKFYSDDWRHSLTLDMLAELNKCPPILYRHLPEEDKREFDHLEEESIAAILNNSEEESYKNIDSFLQKIVPFKRYENRFPYFSLRYLDETNAFPEFFFKISLGKIVYSIYDKTIAGDTLPRDFTLDVYAFGRLSDCMQKEDMLAEIVKELPEEVKGSIRFDQFAPHYDLTGNKVVIYADESFQGKERVVGTIHILPNGKMKVCNPHPSYVINFQVLMRMVVLATIQKDYPIFDKFNRLKNVLQGKMGSFKSISSIKNGLSLEPASFIRRREDHKKKKGRLSKEEKDKQTEYRQLMSERKEKLQQKLGSNLDLDGVPTRILDHLMDIQPRNLKKDQSAFISMSLGDAASKIKSCYNEKNGVLANDLTRDIIDMVIKEVVKSKITSAYYDAIQYAIAYFPVQKSRLITILEELRLLDRNDGHVFLRRHHLEEAMGLAEFYESYFDEKIHWIKKTFYKGRGRDTKCVVHEDLTMPLGWRKKLFPSSFLLNQEWLDSWKGRPLEISTDFLSEETNQALQQELEKLGIVYDNTKDKFSILVDKLFHGDQQAFYEYPRNYRCNGKDVIVTHGLSGREIDKLAGSFASNNEKSIRLIRTQDRIMTLMIQSLMQIEGAQQVRRFILQDIHPASSNNPLDGNCRFYVSYKGKDYTRQIVAEDNQYSIEKVKAWLSLPRSERADNDDKRVGYQWTYKDYGLVRRLLKDRRLESLLPYFEGQNVYIECIGFELEAYDRYREAVFDKIFALERAIVQKDRAGILELERNYGEHDFAEVQFNIYATWLCEKNLLSIYDIGWINAIRNKFSHSQFPPISRTGIPMITHETQIAFHNTMGIRNWKENITPIVKKIYEKMNNLVDKSIENMEKINP